MNQNIQLFIDTNKQENKQVDKSRTTKDIQHEYISKHTYMYIYIYREREREGEIKCVH